MIFAVFNPLQLILSGLLTLPILWKLPEFEAHFTRLRILMTKFRSSINSRLSTFLWQIAQIEESRHAICVVSCIFIVVSKITKTSKQQQSRLKPCCWHGIQMLQYSMAAMHDGWHHSGRDCRLKVSPKYNLVIHLNSSILMSTDSTRKFCSYLTC